MSGRDARPIAILIGALGGEGGGLLADWIVVAARAADLPVQSTSIPGVAQRTGATTYYVEIFPVPSEQAPLMPLYPGPGNVDVVVASELMEAGRAIENGFVSPDRTTLIASTHRIYSIAEKSAMGDGLHDSGRVEYVSATDDEALAAFQLCSRLEGIIPALEPAHALAHVARIAPELPHDHIMVMNLCGRGAKDVFTVAEALGVSL